MHLIIYNLFFKNIIPFNICQANMQNCKNASAKYEKQISQFRYFRPSPPGKQGSKAYI